MSSPTIMSIDSPAGAAERPAVRFGLFTDPHFGPVPTGTRVCPDSEAKIAACVDELGRRGAAFAVCLGDLIDGAGPTADDDLAAAVRAARAYARFPGPRYLALGNHDIITLRKDQFMAACGAENAAPVCAFDCGGIHFVILDGNGRADGRDCGPDEPFHWSEVYLSASQLDWLDADLARARGRPVIVFCHENLDGRLWQGALDPHVARNAHAARARLEAHGSVLAVFQGHCHAGMASVVNGIPYIGLRAMAEGPWPDSTAWATVSVEAGGRIIVAGAGSQPSLLIESPTAAPAH